MARNLGLLSRREVLAAGGCAAIGYGTQQDLPFPADLTPPAPTTDSYGLVAALGRTTGFEEVLRELGEPAILTETAPVTSATFRLTENYALRRPRSARVIFFLEVEPRAVSIMKDYGTRTATDAKPITTLRYFSGAAASRLRLLIDDDERFWDASPVPPDWSAIDCRARNGGAPCPPALDGGASLLEGRVGVKRHAILRTNPSSTSLVQQIAPNVF